MYTLEDSGWRWEDKGSRRRMQLIISDSPCRYAPTLTKQLLFPGSAAPEERVPRLQNLLINQLTTPSLLKYKNLGEQETINIIFIAVFIKYHP